MNNFSVHYEPQDHSNGISLLPFMRKWTTEPTYLLKHSKIIDYKLYYLLYDLGSPPIHKDCFKQFPHANIIYYESL